MVEYSQHGKRIRLQRGVNSIERVKYSENGNVATISLSAGLTASLYPPHQQLPRSNYIFD
eukprot:jgi/Botrbrau1/13573/Bobra.4_2s0031.1